VHDALMRVWQRPQAFVPERGNLRSFLSVCVRNEAIGRKRTAARRFQIDQRVARIEADVSYELDMPDHVELGRLRAALERLPAEQRAALELAYYRHLSHAQIAEALDVPLGTIKSRLALGLRKLQDAFAVPARV
jgi:RNA polymerase sigma-70 factor (ECF subfamily)